MLATIILVSMTCSYAEAPECDSAFEEVYQSQSVQEFKVDGNQCLALLDKLPDVETINMLKFKTYGCYTVDYDVKPGAIYLENMLDKDDSFMWSANDIKVK